MSLYKNISINDGSKLFIWQIDEEVEDFIDFLKPDKDLLTQLDLIGSDKRKKEFLAVRSLLKSQGIDPRDLSYNNDGAPLLKENYISISHTKYFVAIIISDKRIGIDIEEPKEKLKKISSRFVGDKEKELFDTESLSVLSIIWNSKEAMFKLCERNGIDFRENLFVKSINEENKSILSTIKFEDIELDIQGKYMIFNGHTLVYLTL